METDTGADGDMDMTTDDATASPDANKIKYNVPIRCDINVAVNEIEWVTEITDDALNTSADTQTLQYELPPVIIAQS